MNGRVGMGGGDGKKIGREREGLQQGFLGAQVAVHRSVTPPLSCLASSPPGQLGWRLGALLRWPCFACETDAVGFDLSSVGFIACVGRSAI